MLRQAEQRCQRSQHCKPQQRHCRRPSARAWARQVREIVEAAGLQPFPDAYVEGFAFDAEGQLTYPGMQVAVRARAPRPALRRPGPAPGPCCAAKGRRAACALGSWRAALAVEPRAAERGLVAGRVGHDGPLCSLAGLWAACWTGAAAAHCLACQAALLHAWRLAPCAASEPLCLSVLRPARLSAGACLRSRGI